MYTATFSLLSAGIRTTQKEYSLLVYFSASWAVGPWDLHALLPASLLLPQISSHDSYTTHSSILLWWCVIQPLAVSLYVGRGSLLQFDHLLSHAGFLVSWPKCSFLLTPSLPWLACTHQLVHVPLNLSLVLCCIECSCMVQLCPHFNFFSFSTTWGINHPIDVWALLMQDGSWLVHFTLEGLP